MVAPTNILACGLLAAAAPSLQDLVDSAPAGSVLIPPPGWYSGPVIVGKPITLDGNHAVVLDGNGRGTLLRVTAPGVTVKRLRLTGSGESHDAMDSAITVESDGVHIEDNQLDNVLFGVLLSGASNGRVCGNSIRSKAVEAGLRGDAVRIWAGRGNLVDGNEVSAARDVSLANSPGNTIRGNRIQGGRYGVQIVFSPGSRIESNSMAHNLTGIAVLYSDDVVVTGNQVTDSPGVSGVGVVFKESSQGVVEDNTFLHCAVGARTNSPTHPLNVVSFRRNLFAHNVAGMDFYGENGGHVIQDNRFEHNLTQVTVSGPMSARGNSWLHNSWDDYQGFDRDGDGIGDVPYERYAFSDRVWMEEPKATFFRNSPAMELLDFLERLAPFSAPQLILADPQPATGTTQYRGGRNWDAFKPSCAQGDAP